MHSFKIIAAMAILARGVLSEGIHMINCTPWGAAGSERIWRSYVVYCANDADCSSLAYLPPAEDTCLMSTSTTPDSWHIWEGGPQSCTFPSGVTFNWNIPSTAQSQPNFSSVGGGWNDFRGFTGYKDNKVNGAGPAGSSCVKIYYYM